MNKLWVRLGLTFSAVIVLAFVLSFIIFFVESLLFPDEIRSVDDVMTEHEGLAGFWVEDGIINNLSDEEIVTELAQSYEALVRRLIPAKRAEGFAPNVDLAEPTFGLIVEEFIREFFTPDLLQTVLLSSVIGIIAGILMSRYLAIPLERLAAAARAFGEQDLSQRVTVEGSQEITNLADSFNQMAAKLEEAEQLRQNMLADVSHELRTPLTGLEGSLRAHLDHVYELTDERVARLHNQTHHLIRLVEDLRLLAQAEARQLPLERQSTDMVPLLQSTLDLFADQAEEKGVALENYLALDTRPIQADAGRIRQVLHNLLANALRHTSKGGTISVSLSPKSNGVEIVIQDTGEGIDADHLSRIFDRFYRTDKSRGRDSGGTGLGLPIAKAMIEAHGGTITVASDGLGQGATFTVCLVDG